MMAYSWIYRLTNKVRLLCYPILGNSLFRLAKDGEVCGKMIMMHKAILLSARWVLGIAFFLGLSGCLAPIALEQAVMLYDEKVSQIKAKLHLLNVLRARHNLPIHYSTVESIAEEFTFESSIGFGGRRFTHSNKVVGGNFYDFSLGGTVSESPVIKIVPIQSRDYAHRILTPLDEKKMYLLALQGTTRLKNLLQLMSVGAGLCDDYAKCKYLHYFPNFPNQYDSRVFRRIGEFLAGLAPDGDLYLGPLPPLEEAAPANTCKSKKDKDNCNNRIGRILISNYDPSLLPSDELKELSKEMARFEPHWLKVDIKKNHPGGRCAFRGWFQLRSFRGVLDFMATENVKPRDPTKETSKQKITRQKGEELLACFDRGDGDIVNTAKENAPKQTNGVSKLSNPPKIETSKNFFTLNETLFTPDNAAFAVSFRGKIYSIPYDSTTDLKTLQALNMLFEMTLTDVEIKQGLPITIAK